MFSLPYWSIRHPKGIIMIVLALMVLGVFAFKHLSITLLPDIIYPDIRVRIIDKGVPATIMEDKITRQLEEQLAITENAISVRSKTSEGRSAVDLSFPYGTDINSALRDASSRLDRAKRFLPNSIEPPTIYKRDPSQIPILEIIVSSTDKTPVELFQWADQILSKWFVNLPGVASIEVGGGLNREIQVIVDQLHLANYGLDLQSLAKQISLQGQNIAAGRLYTQNQEFSIRTNNQITSIEELEKLPIQLRPQYFKENNSIGSNIQTLLSKSIQLSEISTINDTHEEEKLSIRLNGVSGVKLSIQKQPSANTVEVVEHVRKRLQQLHDKKLLDSSIEIKATNDQSIFIHHALNNASKAALNGTLLAMLVVFLFLGDWRKTLIIGSAIPIAILITFIIMDISSLTLNIMTLGGLALGIGLLVDNTIVMLENISRHQKQYLLDASINNPTSQSLSIEGKLKNITMASQEVSSALTASTSTNLVAVLPFLFIGGLIGLFFEDLIITISASIIASLLVSLTLVPSLATKLSNKVDRKKPNIFKSVLASLNILYQRFLNFSFRYSILVIILFIFILFFSIQEIIQQKHIFLPRIDEGRISLRIKAEPGTKLSEMHSITDQVEDLLDKEPMVETIVSTIGGSVFGRSQYERSNRSYIKIQLNKDLMLQKNTNSKQWLTKTNKKLKSLKIPGIKFRARVDSVRGVRFGNSTEEVEVRIQGKDLNTLSLLADQLIIEFKQNPFLSNQLKNLEHAYDEHIQELIINIKRKRAGELDITNKEIALAVKAAISGVSSTQLIEGDISTNIKLRLDKTLIMNSSELNNIYIKTINSHPILLRDVATIDIKPAPMSIIRENQQRINEITASIIDDNQMGEILVQIKEIIKELKLPKNYKIYLAGNDKELREGQDKSLLLLILAIFLVFTVMVIQYESFRNPLVILFGIPFTLTGVALVIQALSLPISMPVWLGVIMLTGIVVNNSIVLVEQIEISRKALKMKNLKKAIATAASLRVRAIFMTSLTTVFGMLPLALGVGSGTEMLQPLAIIIVAGLSYSIFVSLVLIPNIYYLFYFSEAKEV